MLGLFTLAGSMAGTQNPGLPTMPAAPKSTAESPPAKGINAPTQDNPEATAAEAPGPITVTETVSDDSVRRKLERLLPRYPGVRSVGVEVEDGVVTLTGQVADSEVRDRLREFVRRVQGVNLVLNQTKTDVQVMTARSMRSNRSTHTGMSSRGSGCSVCSPSRWSWRRRCWHASSSGTAMSS